MKTSLKQHMTCSPCLPINACSGGLKRTTTGPKNNTAVWRLMIVLFFFITSTTGLKAQAPAISYTTPQTYVINQAISTLTPANLGGTVPAGSFRNVTTYAGSGSPGNSNNANPLLATFSGIHGVTGDARGNYYVAEYANHFIRKIAANSGAVSVVAFSIGNAYDVVVNPANGDLYFTASNRIYQLQNTNSANYPLQDPTYSAAAVVAGQSGTGSANGTGTAATFNVPMGLAISPDNTFLLVADNGNDRIRKVMINTWDVSTFVGTGTQGSTNGALATATFTNPQDVAIASSTLVYVSQGASGHNIRKIDLSATGNEVSNFAGTYGTFGALDGIGAAALFNMPWGLTLDGAGNLFVVDQVYHKIRKISPAGMVSTIAGSLWQTIGSTNGVGNNALFDNPRGIYFDPVAGCLLVGDFGNDKIRKIDLSGYQISHPLPAGLSFNTGTGVITGTPTDYSLLTYYSNNFDAATAGTTSASGTPTLNGNAELVGSMLCLTKVAANQYGGFMVPAGGANSNLLKVDFLLVSGATGTPADGLSYSFASDAVVTNDGNAEDGSGTKLKVCFRDYSNTGIKIYYNATQLVTSSNVTWTQGKSTPVSISINGLGQLSLTLDGVSIFSNVQLPADYSTSDKSTWKHVFKSRTGSNYDLHGIDNLVISQGLGQATYGITAYNYGGSSTASLALTINSPPTVITADVSSITATTASSGGTVTDAGSSSVTARGVVWGTSSSPTIASYTGITSNGSGTGSFTSNLTGLSSGVLYYIRSYATNSYGTSYGVETSFTATLTAPDISYTTPNNFTLNTAITPLTVTNSGGLVATNSEVSTVAGSGGYGCANGTGTATTFSSPIGITVDGANNVYTYDLDGKIRKITPAAVVTTESTRRVAMPDLLYEIGGSPYYNNTESQFLFPVLSGNFGLRTDVNGSSPYAYNSSLGKAVQHAGVLPQGQYKLVNVTFKPGQDAYYGSTANFVTSNDYPYCSHSFTVSAISAGNWDASVAALQPNMVMDASGNAYLSENYNSVILKITPAGDVLGFAGRFGVPAFTNGTAANARFWAPAGLAIDASGNIFVADAGNHRIRKITPAGDVTTFAGSSQGSADGTGTGAQFNSPSDVAFDGTGNLYIADAGNHRIRKITPAGVVTTVTGTTFGYVDGDLSQTKFNSPTGVGFDSYGTLYIADNLNRRIRKLVIGGYTVSPALPAGLTLGADGTISGTPTAYSVATNYTITANNMVGGDAFIINISVGVPGITSFTPTSAATGTTVTITGTNLTGVTAVSFGGTAATSFTVVDANTITAVVAGGTTGNVSVTNSAGTATSSGTFTYLTNVTWTGTTSTDWNTSTNWSTNAVPTALVNATIPSAPANQPTVNQVPASTAICNNLTIQIGAVLTIAAGKALTVNGTLTNSAGVTGLVVNSGGSLIESTTGISATVFSAFAANEWHLISAPISDATSAMFTGRYLQTHSESTNAYTDITPTTNTLTPMKGYALYGEGGFTTTYTGTLNTAAQSFSTTAATYVSPNGGWNLVGNPYPSSIDWSAASGWTKTNVNNAIYVHKDAATWATYIGGTGANSGTRYIAPCQGFFVQATAAGTLAMTNAVKVHNATTFFKNADVAVPNLLRLQVSGNGYSDEAVVRFAPEATAEFDGSYDAHKLYGDVPEAAQVYTLGSIPLAINSLPATSTVPMGIYTGVAGTYTLTATEINDLTSVTLEDTHTGIFTDLTKGSCNVELAAGESGQRFILHFGPLSIEEKESSPASIYSYLHTAYIHMNENTSGDIFIYSISGQLVATIPSASGIKEVQLPVSGTYIVKVVAEKATEVRKIFIN